MRVQINKPGKSAPGRIPASLIAAAVQLDLTVEVREKGGRNIIELISAQVYDLEDLPSRMTPQTFPEDIDFGTAVGGEAS